MFMHSNVNMSYLFSAYECSTISKDARRLFVCRRVGCAEPFDWDISACASHLHAKLPPSLVRRRPICSRRILFICFRAGLCSDRPSQPIHPVWCDQPDDTTGHRPHARPHALPPSQSNTLRLLNGNAHFGHPFSFAPPNPPWQSASVAPATRR